jgi:hypothetical protein
MAWITETIRFERIPLTARKTARCSQCGKPVRRQRTFGQTVNPYNRNAAGQPKSRQEILAELRDEAQAWKNEPATCAACAETGVTA